MKHSIQLLALLICSSILLVSAGTPKKETKQRLNGHFKSATGNWCQWSEIISDKEHTDISVACQCTSQKGQHTAYTCQYTTEGERLHECKAARPKEKDVYADIGDILSSESALQ